MSADQENAVANKQPKYQKKTQLEHILLRPDTYVGSVEAETEAYWVAQPESDNSAPRMSYRKVSIVPGLYKIFDEILVNAADNKQRDEAAAGSKANIMTKLEVNIDIVAGSIQVRNDGKGISVTKHDEYPMYIPQLIFGELLTSSNYDDDVKQTVGGRNGFGAKLANIFSTRFIVEIDDTVTGKSYRQVWHNNMSKVDAPHITAYAGKANHTSITFFPDLARFGMAKFDTDFISLVRKRVLDIAGTTPESLKVVMDGVALPVKNFKDYLNLYLESGVADGEAARPRVHLQVDRRWELCLSLNESEQFAQVSFVNNIATSRGGTHVNYMTDLVVKAVLELIHKHKGASKSAKELTAADVKRHLFLFVNALVVNPTFDSQTKTNLTSKKADLETSVDPVTRKVTKAKIELPEGFLKKLKDSGIIEEVITRATEKVERKMAKADGKKIVKRLTGIPKLEDANLAGTKDGYQCTLILTEGDSAKALAVSGLSVVGRDKYGVFPLKGKLLNVREASASQLMANAELNHLKQILGLQSGKKYSSNKELRYGRVMIMADQDHDGSHIKGLVINLFAHCWPSLLHLSSPSFLWEFITPIVKVSKGVSASGQITSKNSKESLFYSMPDFEAWRETHMPTNAATGKQETKGWTTKYYKGLGTSTAVEAKSYFSDLERHQIEFSWDDHAAQKLDLAFSAKAADARKEWLGHHDPTQGAVDQSGFGQQICYSDFVDKELILFSMASNQRAIPSIVDGLKPGQRKILFSAFKRNLRREIKVAQLAGYVSEHSAYHHGEVSLCSTLINMAQNFVGSNNVNLFLPNGQFGTRLQGGKDAASARYIFTMLSPVTRFIFPQADDQLLNHMSDDGQQIEPEWYVPILPMVLVNGSAGIGTGWSSDVPNYAPSEIVANLKAMIALDRTIPANTPSREDTLVASFVANLKEMEPSYKGFAGVIKPNGAGRFLVKGVIERLSATSIHIAELPLHTWTGEYKTAVLEAMLAAGEIKEFREYHTDSKVSFVVDFVSADQLACYEKDGMTLYKKFKLNSSLATTNMVLFTAAGKLKKYTSANDILIDFYALRLEFYHKRKAAMLEVHRADSAKLANKVRFIKAVCGLSGPAEKIDVTNRAKRDIVASLDRLAYLRIPKKAAVKKLSPSEEEEAADAAAAEEEEEEEVVVPASASSSSSKGAVVLRASDYDYLMSMELWSLTKEKAAALLAELATSEASLRALEATTPSQMWERDLDSFTDALAKQEEHERKAEEEAAIKNAKKAAGAKAGKKAVALLQIKGELIVDHSDDWDESKVKVPRKKKAVVAADAAAMSIDAIMAGADGEEHKEAAAEAKPKKTKKLAPVAAVAAAAIKKPAAAKKSKKVAESEEEDDDVMEESDEDDDVEEIVAPRARTARAAAAKVTKYVDGSDDDEEDDEEASEAEDDGTPVKAKKAGPAKKPAAAAKSKKSKHSDSEDDEDDFDDEFDDDEDGSDFEMSAKKPKKAAAAAPKAKAAPAPAVVKKAAAAPAPVAAAVVKKPAAAKKPAAKKKKAADSEGESEGDDDDFDEEDDGSDFEAAPKKKKAAAPKKPKAEPVAKAEPVVKPAKPAAAKKTSAPVAPAKDASEMSLMERMAARFASVDLKSSAPAAAAAVSAAPASPKAAASRKLYNPAQGKKKLMDAIPATPVAAPSEKPKATKKLAAPKAAAPKKKSKGSDDDEDEYSAPAAVAAAARPQRASKPVKSYVESEDDNEEDEEDVSVEEISDDEDY